MQFSKAISNGHMNNKETNKNPESNEMKPNRLLKEKVFLAKKNPRTIRIHKSKTIYWYIPFDQFAWITRIKFYLIVVKL